MKTFIMLSLLAVGALAFPQTGETTPSMESVFETDPSVIIHDAEELVPERSEVEELVSAKQDAVYKIATLTFAPGSKGKKFKKYMYRNICPLAAANMHTCIRCEGPGGVCIEFMKFANSKQFKSYGKYKWVPKKAMATYMASGTFNSGMSNSNKHAFDKALAYARKRGTKCSVVKPHKSHTRRTRRARRNKPHFVTTTITFGKAFDVKPWMYKNICPLAAKQMVECYRCKGPDGKCVEFQKFASVKSFKQYTQFKWLPRPLLEKFFKSGSTTNGYSPISEAAFKHKGGLDCEKVQPARELPESRF